MASKAGDIRQGHGSGDSSQGFVVGMSPDGHVPKTFIEQFGQEVAKELKNKVR